MTVCQAHWLTIRKRITYGKPAKHITKNTMCYVCDLWPPPQTEVLPLLVWQSCSHGLKLLAVRNLILSAFDSTQWHIATGCGMLEHTIGINERVRTRGDWSEQREYVIEYARHRLLAAWFYDERELERKPACAEARDNDKHCPNDISLRLAKRIWTTACSSSISGRRWWFNGRLSSATDVGDSGAASKRGDDLPVTEDKETQRNEETPREQRQSCPTRRNSSRIHLQQCLIRLVTKRCAIR